jgi:tRNA(adenine34) deaminase
MTEQTQSDLFYMQQAITLAKTAAANQEVPVGAVLVLENNIVGSGWNHPIQACDPTAHAEIIALREGATTIGNYRLLNTTLYVTLEPCIMCVGAIVHARVKRVVFGAFDPKAGAVQSVFPMSGATKLNHRVEYMGGLLAEECGKFLTDFFRERR